MMERLLVPLDGSVRALRTLPVAVHLASNSGATLVLLMVIERSDEGEAAPTPLLPGGHTPSQLRIQEAEDYLKHVAASSIPAHLSTTIIVREGLAAASILEIVQEQKIDLVVICSHVRTGLKRWMLDSVAEQVAYQSPSPVLLLHEQQTGDNGEQALLCGTARALVPLDGTSLAESAITPAVQLVEALSAQGRGALHLLRAVALPDEDVSSTGERTAIVEQAKDYLRALVQRLQDGRGSVASPQHMPSITWSVTIDNDIAAAIARVAESGESAEGVEACNLIALATHRSREQQRWVIDRVTQRVLQASGLPLLIIGS